jgi:hypothetical protein
MIERPVTADKPDSVFEELEIFALTTMSIESVLQKPAMRWRALAHSPVWSEQNSKPWQEHEKYWPP